MKRPLRWAIGLHEADPLTVQSKVSSLLREGPAVLEEIARHGADGLRLLLEKDAASSVDVSIVTLGARLFNSARAVSLLLQHGYIASSTLQLREMIHSLVLALFLRAHPEKAEAWLRAETLSEQTQLAFRNIWRHVEHGEVWKDAYGYFSTMGHANAEAHVTYSRPRQVFGYDLCLRGVYQPVVITLLFGHTLQILLWFQECFYDWYHQELTIPVDFKSNLSRLDAATKEFHKELGSRASQEDTAAVHDDSLPISEQAGAIISLQLMMEQKRRDKEIT